MPPQIGIIGAGPAGLMLARLLHLSGISSVVVESRSRTYVETRVRAGLLEQGSVDLMAATGMDERLRREGLAHDGTEYIADGERYRVDMWDLIRRRIYIYGQQEVVKDMIAANLAAGVDILFEAEAREIAGVDGDQPHIKYVHDGRDEILRCDFIVGCDGFHGLSRAAIPSTIRRDYSRDYPFAWLGILADAAPTSPELVYCRNEQHGFALFTMRSANVSRCYLQVPPDEDEADWSDDRIWSELALRLGRHDGLTLSTGPITHKSVTPMRSFVSEPMRHGRLFIAGDAAHIVPPTGAKGMNLAISDVYVLSRALAEFYKSGATTKLDAYAPTCLRRIWRAQHFSWWMTSMLHNLPSDDAFDRKRQLAELQTVLGSRAGQTLLAENYAGAPLEL